MTFHSADATTTFMRPLRRWSTGVWTVSLVVLAQGFHRSAYTILAVVGALLTFAGGMVFVRFFDRELDS